MTLEAIENAIRRAKAALARRPDMGLHDDSPATSRWERGTRVSTRHANGTQVESDMPVELGGTGDLITPGWLFRAGLAACATTSIAMSAAAEGIALTRLEVRASSRSDTRGLLGMPDADGQPVGAGPMDLELHVRIGATGVAPERLHALVGSGCGRSPIPCAVQARMPLAIRVDVETS